MSISKVLWVAVFWVSACKIYKPFSEPFSFLVLLLAALISIELKYEPLPENQAFNIGM